MNRKGFAWYIGMLPQILIVVTLLIILLLVFSPKLFNMLAQGGSDNAAKRNFDILNAEIKELLESSEEYASEQVIMSLPSGYVIAGFDAEFIRTNIVGGETEIRKPERCYDNACLCLYDDAPDETGEKNLMRCTLYDDVVFYGFLKPVGTRGGDRHNWMNDGWEETLEYLYLERGTSPRVDFTGTWHIEKVGKDRDYVLVTPREQAVESRQDLYVKCPKSSDDACDDKPYGHVWVENNEWHVCDYSPQQFRCVDNVIRRCQYDVLSRTRCVCDGEVINGEYCTQQGVFDVDCTGITECQDYCEHKQCTFEEEDVCNADPCALGGCSIQGNLFSECFST